MPLQNLAALLRQNPYPGRGIVLGGAGAEKRARILYFIMGRSENSRNRIFAPTEDGIRTECFDPAKLKDPSLIIYHPVRFFGSGAIVTNGDQTDTVRDYLRAGRSFRDALVTRTFEPDAPNYTPRISGIVHEDGAFALSILKCENGDGNRCCRYFFGYDAPAPDAGRFISTYTGDGEPLPPFTGEPATVSLAGEFDAFAEEIWAALNPDNKVSLYACDIDLRTGEKTQRIFNKNQ